MGCHKPGWLPSTSSAVAGNGMPPCAAWLVLLAAQLLEGMLDSIAGISDMDFSRKSCNQAWLSTSPTLALGAVVPFMVLLLVDIGCSGR
jgi:hypothetical protein